MSDQHKRSFWIFLLGLGVLLAHAPRIEATTIKAVFISGNLPGVAIPNKILNGKSMSLSIRSTKTVRNF